jgi:hypothetical protein
MQFKMIKPVLIKLKKKEFKINYKDLLRPDLYGSLPSASRIELPVLEPVKVESIVPIRLVPFHEAFARKDYGCLVHFYTYDQHFIRVLRHPERYLDFFLKFRAVITPDLSQYADMSAEDRYLSAYINRAFPRYLQEHGVTVIPNVTWSLPDSFGYSFTGIPQYSPVAINCNGILKHDVSKYLWYRGYEEAVSRLHPSLIIRYGTRMPKEYSDISVYFTNERLMRLRYGS